jgi:hypothetical protein
MRRLLAAAVVVVLAVIVRAVRVGAAQGPT